ncbi:hypothetical protein KW801_01690 [Candidatus Saccharibacteria bacterium]|nr:hypothetical protein [Candidatus Saccharibacteria bacterium]
MNELVLPPSDISREITDYGRLVAGYVYHQNFPEVLLSDPDHVMIKSSDPADFDTKFKQLKPWTAEDRYFAEIDGRFLVAARFLVPLALIERRPVEWIQIMEPKSLDGTFDYFGVEYAEFFYQDFDKARLMLDKNKIEYSKKADEDHSWLNIRINNQGQEIRITDKLLAETIDSEVESGRARPLPSQY